MKIAVWNCHMAFRHKAHAILAHDPDILIIPESECPDKLEFNDALLPTGIVWNGTNKNKGLGVFSYRKCEVRLLDIHNPDIKTILPIEIKKNMQRYFLLAVWAYNPSDPGFTYVGQIWKAIEYYAAQLQQDNVIIAGDFNSNVFWDKLKRKVSHSMLVKKLNTLGIQSSYHLYNNLTQGDEAHPTFHMYRHADKPYHIDYCFLSQNLANKMQKVEIGLRSDWAIYSDHCPLIVTLND